MLAELKNRRPKLPRDVAWTRDLEVFEGPILSEYRAQRGSAQYVEKWCARSGGITRTLLVRVDQRAIAEYLGRRRTLLSLLTEPSDGTGYVIDRRQGDLVAVYGYYLDDLPGDYLPQQNIVHDETLRPEWKAVPQSYLIDQNWDAKLFSDIERINVNAAAFAHFTQPGTTRTFPQGVLRMHYDGGFPIMHVFNGIRSSMPEPTKPKTTALAAASPGVLTLESPADTAEMVQRALGALPRSRVAFDAVHNWSRLKPSAATKVPPVARDTLVRLCSLLGVRPEALLQPFNTEEEEKMSLLVAGKLIAAYYRMLWRVLQPNPRAEYISANIQVDEEPDVFSYDDFPEDDDEDDF